MKETTAQPTIKLKTRNTDQRALIVPIIFFEVLKINVHKLLFAKSSTLKIHDVNKLLENPKFNFEERNSLTTSVMLIVN